MKNTLFPHPSIREEQDKLISDIEEAIKHKNKLIAHAPTGLGKTAAVLAPVLSFALKQSLTIFFLTSRHTQHIIAIDTLKKIKTKHEVNFITTDLIGRKWMCALPNTDKLNNNDFNEFCKSQREDYKCEFYCNTKKKKCSVQQEAKQLIGSLHYLSPKHNKKTIYP